MTTRPAGPRIREARLTLRLDAWVRERERERDTYTYIYRFLKIRGTFFGGIPIIRIMTLWGLVGVPLFGETNTYIYIYIYMQLRVKWTFFALCRGVDSMCVCVCTYAHACCTCL